MTRADILNSWRDRPVHERWIIGGLGALTSCLLLYLLLIKPVSGYYLDAERNLAAARSEALMAESALAQAGKLQSAGSAEPLKSVEALQRVISASAGKAGIGLSRVQRSSTVQAVDIWLDQTDPHTLFVWLGELQSLHGVIISHTLITPSAKPALMKAQFQLRLD